MARFHFLIVFNIVDQNEWNTKEMEIRHRAAPASIVLFKSNCTILFIIDGSNMREMMMEERRLFRNVQFGTKRSVTGWREVRKGINTTKSVKGT